MNIKGHIKFISNEKSEFFKTVKARVDQYFAEHKLNKNANAAMVIKTIVLLSSYILPFVFIVIFHPPFLFAAVLWLIMGLGLSGIGMSIMHDANHGAYSNNKLVNYLMGHSLNLVGGSVFNWKLQHNILHHTYTNIAHMDDDIADKLLLRFNPHTKVKNHHRIQYVYAFIFYGILTIYWALLKDFIQFVRYTKNGVNPENRKKNVIMVLRMILDKIFYFAVFLGIPLWAGIPVGQVIAGFMIMHFAAGIILTVVFQLAHTVEGTSHPLPGTQGNIENDWAIHQMNTTVNFSARSKFLTWYLGGLNYQVEHHLFPKICHVHYPRIAPIVKQTAAEFGIVYLENETFLKAFQSHLKTLKRFGRPSLNDAIG